MTDEETTAGVIGLSDADQSRAREVADKYGTTARTREDLFADCDVASIAVPTRYHHRIASEAIEYGTDVLVEKPFVRDISEGRELLRQARERDVVLQVGHIERFNPAVRALQNIIPDLEVIAIDVRRLGPPVDRDTRDSVVLDLMIHDIDVLLAVMDCEIESVTATSARDSDHVTAQIEFETGVVANLTASRVTQEKIRDLAVTARDCRVNVDYENQNVQIHRHSVPEYYESDGDLRYRHESIIERPTIESGEPLRAELDAFLRTAADGGEPQVSGEDGLRALQTARRIDEQVATEAPVVTR